MDLRRSLAARALERGALFVSLLVSACRGEPAAPPGARELAARMVAGKFSGPAPLLEGKAPESQALEVRYQLFVPASYSATRRYPLIVSLHGATSRAPSKENGSSSG